MALPIPAGLPAPPPLAGRPGLPGQHQVRPLPLVVCLAANVVLSLSALQGPPFVPAGANLRLAPQAVYAQNIWQEAQISLLVLGLFLPWLVYAVVQPGALAGRAVVFAVALLGVAVSTWAVTVSLESYLLAPVAVRGVVTKVSDRDVTLDCGLRSTYHLVISNWQLQQARPWLAPGVFVLMYVSPRGHAGYIGQANGPPCGPGA